MSSVIFALAAIVGVPAPAGAGNVDAKLRGNLERLAQMRVFFGHQSVGANILDGVRQLALETGIAVRIAEVNNADGIAPGTFGHAWIGENGKPALKLNAFEAAVDSQSGDLDVALVKLCYLDIAADTDVKALFERYRATIARLKTKHPHTIFVHVTAPLTYVQSGVKAYIKRLLGRAPYGAAENVRRAEYNALVRETYGGREPIYDLARIESTAPDGTVIAAEWMGHSVPELAPEFTDDGHHLNAAGRLRAAREFVSVLSAAAGRAPVAGKFSH
jgi:hypothetical protein